MRSEQWGGFVESRLCSSPNPLFSAAVETQATLEHFSLKALTQLLLRVVNVSLVIRFYHQVIYSSIPFFLAWVRISSSCFLYIDFKTFERKLLWCAPRTFQREVRSLRDTRWVYVGLKQCGHSGHVTEKGVCSPNVSVFWSFELRDRVCWIAATGDFL